MKAKHMFRPITKEAAREHIYGINPKCPKGQKYKENRCAAEIYDTISINDVICFQYTKQCNFKNGYGSNELYCEKHGGHHPYLFL